MSLEPGQEEEFGAVCPYLGLADDADSHATYPTDAHRCYRLPNPTRIATHHQETYCLVANHVNCPVYIGEEVPGITRAASASNPAPAPVTPPATAPGATATTQRPRRPAPAGQMPRPRRAAGGTLGPRPRSGGVSMPVATIGLFALAIVVVAIAFGITQLTGNGNKNALPLGNQSPTAAAATTVAAGGSATAPAAQTTTGSATAAATTTTTTGGSGGTYTVESGDTCYGIATANGVTVDALEAANGGPGGACANLNPGDVLTIPTS